MAVHDRRYKRILTSPVFAYDVARLLADEFDLGTVARPTLQAGPTSSVRESARERIADAAWTFDTDRQRTVMMIVEAQSARQRHLAVRLLRYVVDRLLELCEDRQRYDPVGGLPPVVVAVLYTGPDRWRMPSLPDLSHVPWPGLLKQFDPIAVLRMYATWPPRGPRRRCGAGLPSTSEPGRGSGDETRAGGRRQSAALVGPGRYASD